MGEYDEKPNDVPPESPLDKAIPEGDFGLGGNSATDGEEHVDFGGDASPTDESDTEFGDRRNADDESQSDLGSDPSDDPVSVSGSEGADEELTSHGQESSDTNDEATVVSELDESGHQDDTTASAPELVDKSDETDDTDLSTVNDGADKQDDKAPSPEKHADIAKDMSTGHAWHGHADEFPGITQDQFADKIKKTMDSPDATADLPNDRFGFANDDENMVVLYNGDKPDRSTAFAPPEGVSASERLGMIAEDDGSDLKRRQK